ncbi:hypothetical protein PanWU01x14_345720 [Parasponia andersonii]|uniref:Uncharacterized protein n=1 Tax=Parasponia andersonii TaxID=3476 RepID=A0A2P5ACI5_PARAD|nr:hypothetical protein PanWU01x14_345720 [Parasponia andersonii]
MGSSGSSGVALSLALTLALALALRGIHFYDIEAQVTLCIDFVTVKLIQRSITDVKLSYN